MSTHFPRKKIGNLIDRTCRKKQVPGLETNALICGLLNTFCGFFLNKMGLKRHKNTLFTFSHITRSHLEGGSGPLTVKCFYTFLCNSKLLVLLKILTRRLSAMITSTLHKVTKNSAKSSGNEIFLKIRFIDSARVYELHSESNYFKVNDE